MQWLSDMALFVEVAKTRSFTKAATNLAMPTSTLSRRISQLEQHLGLRLLNRSTRSLELTEAGQQYYQDSRNTPCFSYGDISVLAFSFW